jgi:hypothetical protein
MDKGVAGRNSVIFTEVCRRVRIVCGVRVWPSVRTRWSLQFQLPTVSPCRDVALGVYMQQLLRRPNERVVGEGEESNCCDFRAHIDEEVIVESILDDSGTVENGPWNEKGVRGRSGVGNWATRMEGPSMARVCFWG